MDIRKSIDQRTKMFFLKHFDLTRYGHNLKKLKGIYQGKRCFIIGNGPSLVPKDLDLLKNEYTFGFNKIYYIYEKTEWRPTFYCCQDDRIAKEISEQINTILDTPYIFSPINLKWYYDIDINTKYFFSAQKSISDEIIPEFSDNIAQNIIVGSTVAYTAIQLAAYMGFKDIYLLGIDHSFSKVKDINGNIVIDSSVKDYFCKEYNSNEKAAYIPILDVSTKAFIAAKNYSDKNGIKIYNATRGGKLEVFPRIEFDKLF